MSKLITISLSPHLHSQDSTKKLMRGVIIALLPAFAISVWMFGWRTLIVTAVAILSSLLFEFLIQKYLLKKKLSINDHSAILTGMLLAFCLPVNIPLGLVVLGSLVAIGVGKMTFGGIGNNPFNPALIGRVFLFVSFPVKMTSWPIPMGFKTALTDASTGATPLGIITEGLRNEETIDSIMKNIPSSMDMFYGKMGGSLGEVAAIALILGFLYLLIKKIISWHIPVSIIGTVALFTGILWLVNPEQNADPVFHILTGGLLLGAIFMATDYVTSPMTPKGMIIFGIGIGLLTVIIRRYGAYPEGVQFAILIMNAFVPLINSYAKPKRFGEEVKNG
ncbi:MAG: RnfABCDGE type electron transport complex subunit D [Bacteroidales bacterium]|nr:RnfABCDGE type electron transport complex subunit D [Bacteroidales bacterium]